MQNLCLSWAGLSTCSILCVLVFFLLWVCFLQICFYSGGKDFDFLIVLHYISDVVVVYFFVVVIHRTAEEDICGQSGSRISHHTAIGFTHHFTFSELYCVQAMLVTKNVSASERKPCQPNFNPAQHSRMYVAWENQFHLYMKCVYASTSYFRIHIYKI